MPAACVRNPQVLQGALFVGCNQANPRRFEHEVTRFAGIKQLNLSKTFNVMLESVE
jgi:hypothetical protein